MKIRWWALVAVLALSACAEEDDAAAISPEPVAPVTVGVDDEEEPDVAALQARVAELEGQLAAQEQRDDVQPTTPESAQLPSGVDAPAQTAAADEEDDDDGAESSEESEGSSSRRRRRDRDDEPVLINPLDVLLGE